MSCCCGGDEKVRLSYSCSGSANTGYLADRVWRKLKGSGLIQGTCLAAVGADLSGFIVSAQGSEENIVFDGCPVSCGKKIFEAKGLPCTQYIMTDYAVEKGKTEITEAIVDRICDEIREKIQTCQG
ncbi:MAG: putative zinc-binding protein [Spirochaetales bacterium]|nr:putative zinc-binding protein [Spirochaetales bacterium]